MRLVVMGALALVVLAGCERAGNLQSAKDYGPASKAPKVEQPLYDPYAGYGEANARWRPAVIDRWGTVARPGSGQGGGVVTGGWRKPDGVF